MRLTQNPEYLAQLREVENIEFLAGKTLLVTGATGMLGSCLVDAVMQWNLEHDTPCRLIATGRNEAKAKERFQDYWEENCFQFIQQDVCQKPENFPEHVDYIVHAASNADPANMAKYPVDTLLANVIGTKNLMEYGLSHGMKRFLFVSSGEVYGQPNENMDAFTEDYCGPIDLSSPRSCYPEGKRAAEVLCQSYASQYGADVVIVRPCHLFGPTMSRDDSRAVAQFIWSAVDGRDIVMKSDGSRERSHCYVVDAVSAILLVLEKGECGNAYNIADERYQMTIQELAVQVSKCNEECKKVKLTSANESGKNSKMLRQVLCTNSLSRLRWMKDGITKNCIVTTIAILRSSVIFSRGK